MLDSRHIRHLPRVLGLAALLACGSVAAHHSYAMFDMKQSLMLQGTVSEFQWSNPHCFLQLVVKDEASSKEWSVEMQAPADLYRKGWRPGSVKAGDRLTVVIHPTRDGSNSGVYVSAMGPDGKPLFPDKEPTVQPRSDKAPS